MQRLIEAKKIEKNSVIDKEILHKLGFIKSIKDKIKLLNKGKLNERCVFHVDFASEAAKKSVTSIGGSVEILS